MSEIIRIANKRIAVENDGWLLLNEAGADVWPEGDVIVPLADWLARRDTLKSRTGRTGVWLAPADDTLSLLLGSSWPPSDRIVRAIFN